MTEPAIEWKKYPFNSSFHSCPRELNGVYLIWEKEQKVVLYVGKGNIEECVDRHLRDKDSPISNASGKTTQVIYGEIKEENQTGVQNFLIGEYEPPYNRELGALSKQIKVNLPPLE